MSRFHLGDHDRVRDVHTTKISLSQALTTGVFKQIEFIAICSSHPQVPKAMRAF